MRESETMGQASHNTRRRFFEAHSAIQDAFDALIKNDWTVPTHTGARERFANALVEYDRAKWLYLKEQEEGVQPTWITGAN